MKDVKATELKHVWCVVPLTEGPPAVVNLTLKEAASDLIHFILMFITFLLGFAVIAHTIFGPEITTFSTFSDSFAAVYMLMLTGGISVGELSNVDGDMAVLFYLVFMFLVTIILLNVLLAILVDSYMKAKEKELERWQEEGYTELPSMLDQLFTIQAARHLFSFGAVHEALMLHTLTEIKEEKELEFKCTLFEMDEHQSTISIQDIYDALPDQVRSNDLYTLNNVLRCPCLQFVYDLD